MREAVRFLSKLVDRVWHGFAIEKAVSAHTFMATRGGKTKHS